VVVIQFLYIVRLRTNILFIVNSLFISPMDSIGRMPPLLCNRKLDTPVVAMQPKVKHLHGYARTVVLHRNQQWEGRVFLLGQPDIIKGRQ
jgi:hypothetical protein